MEWLRKLGGAGLAPLTDGLVAYWDFNSDANDVVGGNNGTVTGASLTTDRFGNSNRAYSFNGSGQYVLSASTQSLSSSWFTVIQWVKPSSLSVNRIDSSWTLCTWSNAPKFAMNLKRGTSSLAYPWLSIGNTSGNDYTALSSVALSTGTWYMLAWTFTWDTTTNGIKFYKNWVADGQNTFVGTPTSDNKVYIWCSSSWGSQDNLMTWDCEGPMIINRVLSDSEVLALYQLSSQRYLTPMLY